MEREFSLEQWQPRTWVGKAVKEGRIKSISEIFSRGIRILEPEVVDALVPKLEEDILGVSLVQRMHKSGRRKRYQVVAVVGNRDGIVGVGHASAQEIGRSITKAATVARLNVIEVVRGCGSFECGCGKPHSVPFQVKGKSGSVEVTLKPAPRGLGVVAAEVPKLILRLAGIQDAWTYSRGQTRTTLNFAAAVFDALKQTGRAAIPERYAERVRIGEIGG